MLNYIYFKGEFNCMDERLLKILIIYAIIMGIIALINNIINLDCKDALSIIKVVFINIVFSIVLFFVNIVIIEMIEYGLVEFGITLENNLYYLGVPILCSLILFLVK